MDPEGTVPFLLMLASVTPCTWRAPKGAFQDINPGCITTGLELSVVPHCSKAHSPPCGTDAPLGWPLKPPPPFLDPPPHLLSPSLSHAPCCGSAHRALPPSSRPSHLCSHPHPHRDALPPFVFWLISTWSSGVTPSRKPSLIPSPALCTARWVIL